MKKIPYPPYWCPNNAESSSSDHICNSFLHEKVALCDIKGRYVISVIGTGEIWRTRARSNICFLEQHVVLKHNNWRSPRLCVAGKVGPIGTHVDLRGTFQVFDFFYR